MKINKMNAGGGIGEMGQPTPIDIKTYYKTTVIKKKILDQEVK